MSVQDLPTELVIRIVVGTDTADIKNLRQVSKGLHALVQESGVRLRPIKTLDASQLLQLASIFPRASVLDLSECTLLEGLDGLGGMTNMRKLVLSQCTALISFPEMKTISRLQHLSFSGCTALKDVPKSITALEELEFLSFSGCTALRSLPEEGLEEMEMLRDLRLDGCIALGALPKSIGRLVGLQKLVLDGSTAITRLPEGEILRHYYV